MISTILHRHTLAPRRQLGLLCGCESTRHLSTSPQVHALPEHRAVWEELLHSHAQRLSYLQHRRQRRLSTTSFLPTINHKLSSHHQPQASFLPSTTSSLPTINHKLSSYHQPPALFPSSTTSSLLNINLELSSYHQPQPLFSSSTTSSLPTVNHELSSYHQPQPLFPSSTTSSLPTVNHKLSS